MKQVNKYIVLIIALVVIGLGYVGFNPDLLQGNLYRNNEIKKSTEYDPNLSIRTTASFQEGTNSPRTQFYVNWDKNNAATRYVLYYSSKNIPASIDQIISDTELLDSSISFENDRSSAVLYSKNMGLELGEEYNFRMVALGQPGSQQYWYSKELKVKTASRDLHSNGLDTVQGFKVTGETRERNNEQRQYMNISWEPVDFGSIYRVYYADRKFNNSTNLLKKNLDSFTLARSDNGKTWSTERFGLEEGKKYFFRVVAEGTILESKTASKLQSLFVKEKIALPFDLSTVEDFSVRNNTNPSSTGRSDVYSLLSINWDSVLGASKYYLYYSQNELSSDVDILASSAEAYTFGGINGSVSLSPEQLNLQRGKTYNFRMVAEDQAGNKSAFASDNVRVSIPAQPDESLRQITNFRVGTQAANRYGVNDVDTLLEFNWFFIDSSHPNFEEYVLVYSTEDIPQDTTTWDPNYSRYNFYTSSNRALMNPVALGLESGTTYNFVLATKSRNGGLSTLASNQVTYEASYIAQ